MLLAEENRQVTSQVLGFEGTKQSIVIGPLTVDGSENCYVLPYFDEYSG